MTFGSMSTSTLRATGGAAVHGAWPHRRPDTMLPTWARRRRRRRLAGPATGLAIAAAAGSAAGSAEFQCDGEEEGNAALLHRGHETHVPVPMLMLTLALFAAWAA